MKVFISSLIVLVVVAGGIYYYFSGGFPEIRDSRDYRILIGEPVPSVVSSLEGFKAQMEEFGISERRGNVEYVSIKFTADAAENEKLFQEALAGGVFDLFFTLGIADTIRGKELAEKLAPGLPLVFGVVSNPVENGLVESIQSSGNNLTGVTPNNDILVSKRVEELLSIVPDTKRLIMLWQDPVTTGIANLREIAGDLGVELLERQITNADEIETFLNSFVPREGDALVRATDSANGQKSPFMISWALENKVPLSGTNLGDAERGALMSYGADYNIIGRQAARLAKNVLDGINPSDLPIEPPEKVELVINLDTASRLGIEVDPQVIAGARVITSNGNGNGANTE